MKKLIIIDGQGTGKDTVKICEMQLKLPTS